MPGRLSTEQPRWSPDGKAILFTTESSRVYVLDLPESRVRFLAYGHDPEWSPDGTQVAFLRPGPEWEIGLIQADGTHETSLAHIPRGIAGRLVWHPKGEYLLFTDISGQPGVVNTRDGKVVMLDLAPRVEPLAWSPSGRWIAYGGPAPHPGAAGGLYLFDWRDRHTSLLAPAAVASLFWTTDGRTLIALTEGPAPEMLRCDLESGSVQRQRIASDLHALSPSPSGQEILYASAHVPGDMLLGEVGGNRFRTFAHGYLPAWSSDGQSIAFFDGPDEEASLCTQRRNGTHFMRWPTGAPKIPLRDRVQDLAPWAAVLAVYPGIPALLGSIAALPFFRAPGPGTFLLLLVAWSAFFTAYRYGATWAMQVGHDLEDSRVAHALAVSPAALLATLGSIIGLSAHWLWFLPLFALWLAACSLGAPMLTGTAPGSRRALSAAWAFAILGLCAAGLMHARQREALSSPAASPSAMVQTGPDKAQPVPERR